MTLHEFRKNYTYGELIRENLADDPIDQFQRWFDELRQADVPEWFELNAMVLSTGDATEIASRVVLLKSVSNQGFTFFTNYQSAKARQLEHNPQAALNFYWPMFERQVRVEGRVSRTSTEVSDAYFRARPKMSRLGAIASPQSDRIDDFEPLQARIESLEKQYPGDEIPRPEHWGGYQLLPDLIEFWQGKPSRLHDRFQYRRTANAWDIHRLAP
ncbi:MAG: pyridoxamine 5'-phosphate oxidase [Pirellulaceae bacterium]|nr:pyridoxamine 5'-phosphate oxidase [Pirellulaceae bacterium]